MCVPVGGIKQHSIRRRHQYERMRYSFIVTVVVCWVVHEGVGISILPAAAASVPQECPSTSATVGQGTASEPTQIQLPPTQAAPELTPEERQRREQALEGTHLPGPKPSKGSDLQPSLGHHPPPPTSPPTLLKANDEKGEGQSQQR